MAKEEITNDPVMQEALERFEESQDGSDYNRESYQHDIKFARLGEQWPDDVKAARELESRPCLTINKLNPLVRQVVNDTRQNKPAISVSPVDNDADVETADVISGLIRHIERNSNADVAYDTAMDCAAAGGFGFFQIGIDYVNDDSFDMEVMIHRIADPLSVHWDVKSFRFDAADWEYCFVSEMMKENVFEKLYPDAELVSFENGNEHSANWIDTDQVRVAAYWTRELEKRTLFQLSDGRAIRKDDVPAMAKKFGESGGLDFSKMSDDDLITGFLELSGLQINRQREVEAYKVVKRMISGKEVLEETPWPGSTIPIVPVWGDEVIIDDRRYFRSMIADAIDSQRMFNYWRSAETELVALAPKAPWVGPVGFIPEGHEEKWESANTRSFPYLEYEPSSGGAPTRQPFAGVPAGALQEALNASDDIKATTGIYDASLGARSNETSGKAILARQREGDNANFHFPDNLNRAIQYAGQVAVEIIPHVYSPQKTIRILGEDSKEDVIQLVQEGQERNYQGANKLYDLSVGRYDVAVKAGPSYASQREETRETLIEIMRSVPDAGPYIGDIVMEHLDFQGADRVAKRLKMLLPEEIRSAEDQESVGDLPEEAQAVLNQANQQIQMLKQALEQAQQENMPEQERLAMEKATHEIDLKIKQVELAIKQKDSEMKEVQAAMGLIGQDDPKPQPEPVQTEPKESKAPTIKMEHSAKYEQEGMEIKAAMSTQIAEALDRLTTSNEAVAAMAMAPTKIIRDDTGKAVGAVKEIPEDELVDG